MATEKQIDANRANAQQSTGPRTEAGKTASSQNAVKHSLTSKYLMILPGQEPAFAELESGLRGKLNPQGALEEVVYKRVVECAWNLERCRMAELEILTHIDRSTVDPLINPDSHDRYDRIHRYARESENSMFKSMRELGKLQTEQQFRDEAFQLTQEQADNPAFMAQSPHSISSVCSLAQVIKNLLLIKQNARPPVASTKGENDGLEEIARNYTSRYEANSAKPPNEQTNAAAA